MEKRKSKPPPAAGKVSVRRTVSDPAARLATPQTIGKSKLGSDKQPSATKSGRNSGATGQKQSVSRASSNAKKELEKLERIAVANTSFSVLVLVLVAVVKWRKIKKKPLTKAMSLPVGKSSMPG